MCDTSIMKDMKCEQIDPYNLSVNVVNYNHKAKTQICRFLLAYRIIHPSKPKLHQDAPTFQINCREASV